jgi:hypothetical protein
VCQKDPTPEAPDNSLATVSVLVNLQDPIPKTPENPATPIDASVVLQGLWEPVVAALDVGPSLEGPTVTSSTISLPPKGARLPEPIVASSALIPPSERVSPQELIVTSSAVIAPPPERARPQEPIITLSAVVTPPPEQVCFITKLFTSFPCAALILCLLSGPEPLGVAFL